MRWWVYYLDVFKPVEVEAYSIDEVVEVGLGIAGGIIGGVVKYCVYEGVSFIIVEYWGEGGLPVKLINANNPIEALTKYYEAEGIRQVKCRSINH